MSAVLVQPGGVPGSAGVLALVAQQPAPPPGQGPEFGKASPIGLVVILLLTVATVLLIRSMSKRIRRLPASFDPPDASPPDRASRGDADPDADPDGGRGAAREDGRGGATGRPAGRNVEDAGDGRA